MRICTQSTPLSNRYAQWKLCWPVQAFNFHYRNRYFVFIYSSARQLNLNAKRTNVNWFHAKVGPLNLYWFSGSHLCCAALSNSQLWWHRVHFDCHKINTQTRNRWDPSSADRHVVRSKCANEKESSRWNRSKFRWRCIVDNYSA